MEYILLLLIQPICSTQHLEFCAAVDLIAYFLQLLTVESIDELLGKDITLL